MTVDVEPGAQSGVGPSVLMRKWTYLVLLRLLIKSSRDSCSPVTTGCVECMCSSMGWWRVGLPTLECLCTYVHGMYICMHVCTYECVLEKKY